MELEKGRPLFWWRGEEFLTPTRALKRLLRGKNPFRMTNFGDDLSPFLVEQVSGQPVRHESGPGKLLALGSVLYFAQDNDHIWGSGLLTLGHLNRLKLRRGLKFHAVRGPRTRAAVVGAGFECPEVYGDPALLLPRFCPKSQTLAGRVGLVPHFEHARRMQAYVKDPALKIIDVERPWRVVVDDITSCEVVLSTSMHGLIVAEAYGIPALLLVHEQPLSGSNFKFEDYFESTGRTLRFEDVGPENWNLSKLVNIAARGEPLRFDADLLLRSFPARLK